MFLIRSGIPALDEMLHPGRREPNDGTWEPDQFGIFLPGASRTTSICIAGPDGTGKSVLAMHFASRYLADCHEYCRSRRVREPAALYVSSDLAHGKADAMWTNFSLDFPNMRRVPFKYPQWDRERPPRWLGGRSYDVRHELRLAPYVPEKLEDLADYIYGSTRPQSRVAFIDLASHTAGDDWGLIERLLAALPEGVSDEPSPVEVPRHLLLVDAMEGMETFGGDIDAFGQRTTRRGQVAKLMRLASTKCHLILIVEEPREGARLAEQFVADVVLRLRATEEQGYSRRTIEIEKARGQSHVRGRHPYVVRDGRGSTTGEQVNFDDPRVEERSRSQSYLDVYPSLHSMSRAIMENRAPGPQQLLNRRAGFGIEELDEMLAKDPEPRQGRTHGQDTRGLPCGTVSVLIGDANTQKSFLGHAFLGHIFHDLVWQLVSSEERFNSTSTLEELHWSDSDCVDHKNPERLHFVKHLCSATAPSRQKPIQVKKLSHRVRRWAHRIENAGRNVAGAAVLVTTKDENNRTLVERFREQLREETMRLARFESRAVVSHVAATWKDVAFHQALTAYLESRTICRRLEIHDTPSAVLFHVIRRSIEAAQQVVTNDFSDVCFGGPLHPEAFVRAKEGWRIRFVLDDFNSVMRTYGRVHDDPLFLPFLLLNLRREGLSALIIETQSGKQGVPAVVVGDDAQSDLRALSDHRLYTWHIPDFFGDHRIAIAAIPPMVQQDKKSPVRVRELEWYEPNSLSPPRVNPQFELYDGLEGNKPTLVPLRVHLYAETSVWDAYVAGLNALWMRVFVPPKTGVEQAVVVGEQRDHYEMLRNVSGLYANTNIDYSLIVQVDEFWQHVDTFRPQIDYLTRPIEPTRTENIFREPLQKRTARQEWFEDIGYGLDRALDAKSKKPASVDRVPFVWDFGFLACKEELWEEATHEGAQAGESWRRAADVWKRLKQGSDYTWRDVLEAAVYVAKWEALRQAKPVTAFDLAMMAPQSFSCLLMEVWLSEIYKNDGHAAKRLATLMKAREWGGRSNDLTLFTLVRDFEFELYCSWLLLAESLDLNAFHPRKVGFGFESGRDADVSAVVTRHWYKSAALLGSTDESTGPARFCRLPGAFSVRGDWFLATMRGSRSDRLADRALDLLSSTDANVERLMHGLGLPTRRLNVKSKSLSSRLRGWHCGSKATIAAPAKPSSSTLNYEDVLALGVTKKSKHFHWLWRSNLQDYNAASTIWERWLFRILRRWKSTREYFAGDWVNGFKLYDDITTAYLATDRMSPYPRVVKGILPLQVVSIEDFPRQCKKLRDELDQLRR